jgi:peptide/nickel transport system permease protein
MGLLRFAVRRTFMMIPILLSVTVISFLLANYVPGDPLAAMLGIRALNNPQIVANYRKQWGLDKPIGIRYLTYMNNLIHGDMGRSTTTLRPVAQDLRDFLPATVELTLGAISFAVVGGFLSGILAAVHHKGRLDSVVRIIALTGSSVPVFWLALIALQIFYVGLHWAPGPVGRLDPSLIPPRTITGMYTVDALLEGNLKVFLDALRHLILPSIVLGYYVMGLIARIVRSSLLDTFSMQYTTTARGKGLSELVVLMRHELPNALIPAITIVGLAFAGLLAGAVLTETIFSWPGIGRYAVEAASNLDFQAILGVTIVIAIIYAIVNMVVDLTYGIIDPRIRSAQ